MDLTLLEIGTMVLTKEGVFREQLLSAVVD